MPTDPGAVARAVVPRARLEALCAGHFPGDPIVPGAYIAGLLAEVGALAAGREARLAEVERCTFLAPLRPSDGAVLIATRATPGPHGTVIDCELRVTAQCVARGRVRFT